MSGPWQLPAERRVLLPNTLNVTPRQFPTPPFGDLHLWASGDPLQASDLNNNFITVASAIGAVATAAATADPALDEIVTEVVALADQLDRIETHLGQQAKRTAQTSIPLAALASLKKQLDSLEGPLRHHADALQAQVLRQDRNQDLLDGRLQALEQMPVPPTTQDVAALSQALEASHRQAAAMQAELDALRQEVGSLRQEQQEAVEKSRHDMLSVNKAMLDRIEGVEKGRREGAS